VASACIGPGPVDCMKLITNKHVENARVYILLKHFICILSPSLHGHRASVGGPRALELSAMYNITFNKARLRKATSSRSPSILSRFCQMADCELLV
jgi:hypothetical protein